MQYCRTCSRSWSNRAPLDRLRADHHEPERLRRVAEPPHDERPPAGAAVEHARRRGRRAGTWNVQQRRAARPSSVFGSVHRNPSAVSTAVGRVRGAPPRRGSRSRSRAPAPGHHAGPGRGLRRPPSGAGPSDPCRRAVSRRARCSAGAPRRRAAPSRPAGTGCSCRLSCIVTGPIRVKRRPEIPGVSSRPSWPSPPPPAGPPAPPSSRSTPSPASWANASARPGSSCTSSAASCATRCSGGCARTRDIDLTTSAKPPETVRVLQGWADQRYVQGARFGTVGAREGRAAVRDHDVPGGDVPGGRPAGRR